MLKRLIASLTLLCLSVSPVLGVSIYTTDSGCSFPFYDTEGHPFAEEICFLYNEGVVQGHSERNFLPDHTITRAEFLKIATLALSHYVTPEQDQAFIDTFPGDWYFRYVTYARKKGWIQGYQDGSFKPNNPITRAEAIVLIINMAEIIGTNPQNLVDFYDVSEADWFGLQVSIAHERNMLGIFEPFLHPHDYIKRGESAYIATRVWEELYDDSQ